MAAAAPRNEVPATTNLILTDSVVTESVLAEKARGQAVIEVGAKSIVTPSARDWLRHNKVELRRVALSSKLPTARANNQAIFPSNCPIATRVCEELGKSSESGWKTEAASSTEDAVAKAIQAVDQGVAVSLVFSGVPEKVACLANRNEKVRAAVVGSVADIERVRKSLQANVYVISALSKNDFELLRMARLIAG